MVRLFLNSLTVVPSMKTLDAHACWNRAVTADSNSPAASITIR